MVDKNIKTVFVNFWYYHKKKMIVVIPIVVLSLLYLISVIFAAPPYDMRVIVALSDDSIDEEKYRSAFAAFAEDLDKNGEVSVTFDTVFFMPKSGETTEHGVLEGYLQGCEAGFCLVDQNTYEALKFINNDGLSDIYESLEDAEGSGIRDISKIDPNDPKFDGERYYLKGSALEKELDGEKVPEGLALVLRYKNNVGSWTENHEAEIDYLFRLVKGIKTPE